MIRQPPWQRPGPPRAAASPGAALLVIGLALTASLFLSLAACDGAMGLADVRVGSIDYTLPAESQRQIARFRAVYDRYVDAGAGAEEGFAQFADAFKRVRVHYVRPVDEPALIDAAIVGVTNSKPAPGKALPAALVEAGLDSLTQALDPHSAYLTPEEFADLRIANRGSFGGLGIEVTVEAGFIKVVSPIDETPAARAGLKPGDLITHLDGTSIKDKGLEYAVKRMRGEPGTAIRLTVRRGKKPAFDVTVVRDIINVSPVRQHLEGNVGYLRVTRFTESVEEAVDGAVRGLARQAGGRLVALVLDLRGNPGGLLEQALALADHFMGKGRIVSVRGRGPEDVVNYDAKPGDLAAGLPMVVLIDGGSASASEIVASALQQSGRAVVMGQRSFGKGSVQTISPLPRGGGLKITTQLYYAPSGQTIQALGIDPNLTLKAANDNGGDGGREADLKGALSARSDLIRRSIATVDPAKCPASAKDDKVLDCALAFLKAGSTAGFLNLVQ